MKLAFSFHINHQSALLVVTRKRRMTTINPQGRHAYVNWYCSVYLCLRNFIVYVQIAAPFIAHRLCSKFRIYSITATVFHVKGLRIYAKFDSTRNKCSTCTSTVFRAAFFFAPDSIVKLRIAKFSSRNVN